MRRLVALPSTPSKHEASDFVAQTETVGLATDSATKHEESDFATQTEIVGSAADSTLKCDVFELDLLTETRHLSHRILF